MLELQGIIHHLFLQPINQLNRNIFLRKKMSSLAVGEKKTDSKLSRFFTILLEFTNQTINRLINKIIDRVINNENSSLLQLQLKIR